MAEPQIPLKTTGMARSGQPILIDSIPPAKDTLPRSPIVSQYADYEPDEIDYNDLSTVNRQLNELRTRLHRIRKEMIKADREFLRARFSYESEKKRIMISISGATANEREAMSELLSEDKYSEMLVAQQVAKELSQHNSALRSELEALRELSMNARRIMDLQ